MATPAQVIEQGFATRRAQGFQKSEEERIANRNAQAAVLEQALNNPDTSPQDRHALLTQHAALFQPHEAPDLFQRLAGLIHGQQKPAEQAQQEAAPVEAAQPQAPPVLDPLGIPYSDPQQGAAAAAAPPPHPFSSAPHPILNRFNEALDALGNHLKGFQQPMATPPVNPNADDVLARTYKGAPAIAQDVQTRAAQNQINLEKERLNRYKLTRSPQNKFLDEYAQTNYGVDSFSDLDADKQAEGLAAYKKANLGPKIVNDLVFDSTSPTGASKITKDAITDEIYTTTPNIPLPRGYVPTRRITYTKDPVTGLTKVSVSNVTPQGPGVPGTPVSTKAPKAPINVIAPPDPNVVQSGPQAAADAAGKQAVQGGLDAINAAIQGNKGKAGAPSRKAVAKGAPVSSAAPVAPVKSLDADGQIPISDNSVTKSVREAAQQLIDDKDVDNIPTNVRELGAAFARQYGWSQGKFTPRELTQVNEAANFLHQFQDSPSLSVLDSFVSRNKIAEALSDTDKKSAMGRMVQIGTSMNLSPAEAEFIRNYNATVGTVNGLAALTRSGRPTEAAVNRLKAELPHVLQSANSADAKQRIQQLLKEIDIAKEKSGGVRMSGAKGATTSTTPTTAAHKVGDKVTLKNGQTIVISKVYPDGSFD